MCSVQFSAREHLFHECWSKRLLQMLTLCYRYLAMHRMHAWRGRVATSSFKGAFARCCQAASLWPDQAIYSFSCFSSLYSFGASSTERNRSHAKLQRDSRDGALSRSSRSQTGLATESSSGKTVNYFRLPDGLRGVGLASLEPHFVLYLVATCCKRWYANRRAAEQAGV